MGQTLVRPYETSDGFAPRGRIDEMLAVHWKRIGVQPKLCTDAVFLRRAYLDIIGAIPTADEARTFLSDQDPNKRALLITRLLNRDEFADYWSMKWSDLLRVKSEFPINLWPLAAQGYYRWIRTSIKENMPYDRFARTLLTATGSNFRNPEVNFMRAVQSKKPDGLAQTVALTFMGARAEKWPKARLAGMAGFFSQVAYKATGEWKEEIVYHDPSKPLPATIAFPDGTKAKIPAGQDPRVVFADWLTGPKNPWFARAIVNRIWAWLMGRGLINEPDDIRPDNPPQNAVLLAWLENELVVSKYDLKHIFALILNSSAYQLSPVPAKVGKEVLESYACYPVRRLEAEVLIDAINQITGTTETYSSSIPEPFTFVPEDQRTITLPDGSITSSFLELFGRPARDTGFESERNNKPSPSQRLHVLNSSHIKNKIERGPGLVKLFRSAKAGRGAVDQLYLTILSRFPTDEELAVVGKYVAATTNKQNAAIDIAWALINSAEFEYRH